MMKKQDYFQEIFFEESSKSNFTNGAKYLIIKKARTDIII